MAVTIRQGNDVDAERLSELLLRNRTYFSTGQPALPEEYYTTAHQTRVIRADTESRAADRSALFLIEADGVLVGRANLSSIIRGAFQSASIG